MPSCLQGKKEQECLHAIESPVHEVAHEERVCLRAVSSDLEELHEIVELPMDVTTCAWR